MEVYDPVRLAHEIHGRGSILFDHADYASAEQDFRKSLALIGPGNPARFPYMLSLANTCQMIGKYDEAESMYGEIMTHSADESLIQSAQSEVGKLTFRRGQGIAQAKSEDTRLVSLFNGMISQYPGIRRPVNLVWVDESQKSLNLIWQIQEQHNTPQDKRITSLDGWEAISHIIGDEHWIFIKSNRWRKASDSELRGLMSHELAHEEIKDILGGHLINPNHSDLGFICNERATDLIAIAKGFGPDLMASRKYMERHIGSFRNQAVLLNAKEIQSLLKSLI